MEASFSDASLHVSSMVNLHGSEHYLTGDRQVARERLQCNSAAPDLQQNTTSCPRSAPESFVGREVWRPMTLFRYYAQSMVSVVCLHYNIVEWIWISRSHSLRLRSLQQTSPSRWYQRMRHKNTILPNASIILLHRKPNLEHCHIY